VDDKFAKGVTQTALKMMGWDENDIGPQPLRAALEESAGRRGSRLSPIEIDYLIGQMLAEDPNAPLRNLFTQYFHQWDYVESLWANGTPRNTVERRMLVYERLALEPELRALCDIRIPARTLENEPTVIADEHERWYTPERRAEHSFYWDSYRTYLANTAKWPPESLDDLNRASDAVLQLIADPCAAAAYQSKGLVVGYVQSGKTANFIGVIAKAADSGYRLIIVLAGTLDILRSQTQRRIDKQLIGKEMIRAYTPAGSLHDYAEDRDWDEFVEYGELPSNRRAFDWRRLTGAAAEYKSVGQAGLPALEFERKFADRRLNDPYNLHAAAARIVVIKKHATIISKLKDDLGALVKTNLDDLPALIIDDESDQASINTVNPNTSGSADRTAINNAIVGLLQQLPRAQYVGYTATPFANVFVDPSDAADLFPRDFIISLPRPEGYMGTAEFLDTDALTEQTPREKVYVRSVTGEDDVDRNLPRALDVFVLAGAIKLFREAHSELRYRHHTMLVHRSAFQSEHHADATLVRNLFSAAGYGTSASIERLKEVYVSEFPARDVPFGEPGTPHPAEFRELETYLSACIKKLGDDPVIIVNGDRANYADTPDFEKAEIWRILVGGTKLSRGYTVEGLTVSYYRRKAKNADTLMQMGRWFGFRRGYRDLVRLFIGVAEPDGKRTFNLLEAFKSICRDEEDFRSQLKLYSGERTPRITPLQVPPLVPAHLLRPTAPNKMYNAILASENMGGKWLERTLLPDDPAAVAVNAELMADILQSTTLTTDDFEVKDEKNVTSRMKAHWGRVQPDRLIDVLKRFQFTTPGVLVAALAFLTGEMGDPRIDEWLLLAPQVKSDANWGPVGGLTFSVADRSRREESAGYKAFSEPRHRAVAEHLARVNLRQPLTAKASELSKPRQGVILLYPCKDYDRGEKFVSMGFALLAPNNDIVRRAAFTVRDAANPKAVVVNV
jgi:hypothetical protein